VRDNPVRKEGIHSVPRAVDDLVGDH